MYVYFLVCEEIERALQLEGIKRFVSGIHPSLTIIERKTRYSSVFRCMGSLIGKRFVLTSGRCVYTGGANFVRLGIRSDKTSAIGMNIKVILKIYSVSQCTYITSCVYF